MALKLSAKEAKHHGLTPRKRKGAIGKLGESSARKLFIAACIAAGLPEPIPEYHFDKNRKWAFDWAWPNAEITLEPVKQPGRLMAFPDVVVSSPLALEIDGVWSGGKHNRALGIINDQAKRNSAVIMGWRVLVVTPQDIASGAAINLLKRAFSS